MKAYVMKVICAIQTYHMVSIYFSVCMKQRICTKLSPGTPRLEDGHTKETKEGGLSTFTNLSLVCPLWAKESQEEIRNKNKLTNPVPRRMCHTAGQKPGRTSQQQIKIKNQQEGGTNVQALLP